ncbi:porin [Ancylobacter sp. Lp-2]|uniref:porin n=1 Tax=Ancylobacter sp. Lp-2 TaxID=2881339 RepID=UPI001E58285A|nr:porin [Ancylobacter sp. Lp-2]MCB4769932.1 porin [Ancylobacter sp. Lp-2]
MRAFAGSHGALRRFAAPALLVAAGLVAASSPGVAGSTKQPAAQAQTSPSPASQSAAEDRPDPVCASFGKGFTRIAGTSTCVKISGNVQVDGYQQSMSAGSALAPALSSK